MSQSIPDKPLVETRCLSSLVKVFPDQELTEAPFHRASAFRQETFSFQIAYRARRMIGSIAVRIESELRDGISIRLVGLVPSELPMYMDRGPDQNLLRSTPGLYPDPLYPLGKDGIRGMPRQWRSIWITVELTDEARAGEHAIEVYLESEAGEPLCGERFELEVLPAALPEQKLIHTEWFHTDCLAVYYGVDVFSEAHWKRIDQFVRTAARHGMNMMLTPLFTPPLDTEIGGERPTVRLVDVEKHGNAYRFGFARLERWIELCSSAGIRYIEFSHLFTQWGAKHAPKIMVTENGEITRMFGWDTDASGEAYTAFLRQFLDNLLIFVRDQNLRDRVYFHVSDEPRYGRGDLEPYRAASQAVAKQLADFPVIDALSEIEFYREGLVKNPIPSNNHIAPFLEEQIPNLWTYYCCSQFREVSNRFFCFPSARNRIIGLQLYKFDIKGFLHWGYNFWFTQYSRQAIDPYKVTDAGCAFPSGDAFLVYPGEEGPVESIRQEVFQEALQDMRALQLLEDLVGKEKVLQLLEEDLEEPISFNRYPQNAEWLLRKREQINRMITRYNL